MYEFPYKYTGRKSDNYPKLLFTDTDSLVYEIETDDVYVKKTKSKKKIINEFVRLKSIMYSLVIGNNKEIKKAKHVNKNVIKT